MNSWWCKWALRLQTGPSVQYVWVVTLPTDLEWLSAAQLRPTPPRLDMCVLFMTLFKLDVIQIFDTGAFFFSTPPLQLSRCVFNWVPKCGCVERYWNISHMVGGEKGVWEGGSLCVCGTWINLCDVNKRVDAHRISRKTAGADLDDIPAALYQPASWRGGGGGWSTQNRI